MCGMNNSYRHLHQLSPIFLTGSKSAKIPRFWPHLHSERCDSKTEQKNQKCKTILYSADVWALICRRPHAARAPNSDIHCPNWDTIKCENWKKKRLNSSNSAARGQIAFRFYKIILCGTVEAAELSKPTEDRIQDGGRVDDAQIFNIRAPISFERLKLETLNLVYASIITRSNFDSMQKLGQRGHDTV